MAAIRNIGKNSDKCKQLFMMAPDLIGEKVVVSSAPDTTRRAILSGSLVESPDVWVAKLIQDYHGVGFRRKATIYRNPYALCTGHSMRITPVHPGATYAGDGYKFIVVLTGKYASLTLGEIYDTLDKALKEEERKEEERKEEERKEEERKEEERKEAERKEQERKELQRILLLERREEIQRELVALQNEIETL